MIEDEVFEALEDINNHKPKDFERAHNRSIFDSLNETLNIFRPFYLVHGMPYPWTYSEKHLSVIIITESNYEILFEKIK